MLLIFAMALSADGDLPILLVTLRVTRTFTSLRDAQAIKEICMVTTTALTDLI